MVDKNLHHLLVLLKILNIKKLEWVLVLVSKFGLWWRWVTIIWFSTWMVFLCWLVLMLTSEGQTRSHPIVLKLGLKKFLSICVKKFTVYICSSAMKRNFLRHLDIIIDKICVLLSSTKILDHTFCFRNCHFLLEKPDKPIFHRNLKFFPSFP
jgi:hypothetical protein